jgi:hypothetical protein
MNDASCGEYILHIYSVWPGYNDIVKMGVARVSVPNPDFIPALLSAQGNAACNFVSTPRSPAEEHFSAPSFFAAHIIWHAFSSFVDH